MCFYYYYYLWLVNKNSIVAFRDLNCFTVKELVFITVHFHANTEMGSFNPDLDCKANTNGVRLQFDFDIRYANCKSLSSLLH